MERILAPILSMAPGNPDGRRGGRRDGWASPRLQGLAQSVEQAGQSLRQGMAQDTSRLPTLLRREVEQILAPLPAQVVQALREAERAKRGWRR